jgi:hypothetical protein
MTDGMVHCEDEDMPRDPRVDEEGMTHWGGDIGTMYREFESYIIALGFKYIDNGAFRNTFQRGKVVIKIPRNSDGINDNRVEAAAWRKYKNKPTDRGILLAPCRLLPNNCLMMATVDTRRDVDEEPPWVNKIEGEQVGEYRGRVVAYDYALNMPERVQWEEEWGVSSEFFFDEQYDRLLSDDEDDEDEEDLETGE